MPQLHGLPPGFAGSDVLAAGGPGTAGRSEHAGEQQIAGLLARPAAVLSIHRPVVTLHDGSSVGYEATIRVEGTRHRGFGEPSGWFAAAARSGLSGRLGATALVAALHERVALPEDHFLAVPLDVDALGHPEVVAVFDEEDDLTDLVVTLVDADLPDGHRAGPVLDELRERGLRVAVPVGSAGLTELRAVERLSPDVVTLPGPLVRDVHASRLRRRLVDVAVELADDLGAVTLAHEVETLEETEMLRTLGVGMAHGWLFGRPHRGFPPPPEEIRDWLTLQIDLR